MKNLKVILSIILVFVIFLQPTSSFAAKSKKTSIESPTNILISNITDSEVTISWNSVKRASGYEIYYSEDGVSFRLASKIDSTSFNHANLTPNTQYEYYVKAYNKFATSDESEHIVVKTTAFDESEPTPEPTPEPTLETNTPKVILGYATYYYNGDQSSLNSIDTYSTSIDEIVIHTYATDEKGNLSGLIPTEQIQLAKERGIKVQASVTNNFSGDIASEVLQSATNRRTLIENIKNEIVKYEYSGVNIDIEGVYYYDREYFSYFMKELYEELHPYGYLVTVAVPAKTYDNPTHGWSGAYDYEFLANYVDQFIIMTYDEHYPGGSPGPIASIDWVRSVIDYTISVISKDKILVGTAAYAYDWASTGTKAYGIEGAYRVAETYGSSIQWDSVSQSPYFTYIDSDGVEHEVWIENSYSVDFKLKLVNEYDLLGVAIWRLGLESERYWTVLDSRLE